MGQFLDYLNNNKNILTKDYNEDIEAQSNAAQLDAKRMQNTTTKSELDKYSDDPDTQFIIAHPEAATNMIAYKRFQYAKPLIPIFQNAIRKNMQDLNGQPAGAVQTPMNNSYDPKQSQILGAAGADTGNNSNIADMSASADGAMANNGGSGLGDNPDTNLPASPVNDPIMQNDGAPTSDSSDQIASNDAKVPNIPSDAQSLAETPNNSGKDSSSEYEKYDKDIQNHRNRANQAAAEAQKEAKIVAAAKVIGVDYSDAPFQAALAKQKNEMEQANQKMTMMQSNPKIIAQRNAVETSSKIVADAQEAAVHSQLENEKLDTLKESIKKLPTGQVLPARQKLGEYLSGFGFDPSKYDISKPASESELVKSGILDQVFGSVKQAVGGRVSGQEMSTFYQKLPSLLMTPEGNVKIIDFIQSSNSNAPAYYKAAQKWMANNNNDLILSTDKDGDTFNDKWIKSRQNNNILKEYQGKQNSMQSESSSGSAAPSKDNLQIGDKHTNSKGQVGTWDGTKFVIGQ